MDTKMLILAIQIFILTVALRYVGFNREQSLVLTSAIVSAIHTK